MQARAALLSHIDNQPSLSIKRKLRLGYLAPGTRGRTDNNRLGHDTQPAKNMSLRSLRACMVCSIIQPGSKFRTQGCPNCESFLEMRGSDDVVQDATSAVFEGMITMANPQDSWVAKWQRVQGLVPGMYAVKVVGLVSYGHESVLGCR